MFLLMGVYDLGVVAGNWDKGAGARLERGTATSTGLPVGSKVGGASIPVLYTSIESVATIERML